MNTQARKKRKKPPTLMPTTWDQGATGKANRIGLVEEPATELDPTTGKPQPNPNGVKRMRRVDMLEIWHRKRIITTAGFNAAERLRDAFEATQRAPGWPDNDRVQSSPKPDHAVTIQVDRISRFHAINRLVIDGDAAIISAVVLDKCTPAQVIMDGKRPYRGAAYQRGLDHLRDALERLAKAMGV